jgi:hypothetical protein
MLAMIFNAPPHCSQVLVSTFQPLRPALVAQDTLVLVDSDDARHVRRQLRQVRPVRANDRLQSRTAPAAY